MHDLKSLKNQKEIVRQRPRISADAILIFPYPEKKQVFFRN